MNHEDKLLILLCELICAVNSLWWIILTGIIAYIAVNL